MSADLHRFVTLTSKPQLGRWVLGSDAAVLFSGELDEVLWANAAGARLFGGTGLRTLLESPISATQPFIRQVRDAAAQIENGEPIIRGFRISRGLSMQFIQCELTPIDLEEGAQAILLVCDAPDAEAGQREHERAEQAIAALKGLAASRAILDGHGLVLAASQGFAEVAVDDDELEAWMGELASSGEAKLLRTLAGDDAEGAALVRLSERPARYLIVTDAALVAAGSDEAASRDAAIAPDGGTETAGSDGDAQAVAADLAAGAAVIAAEAAFDDADEFENETGDEAAEVEADPAEAAGEDEAESEHAAESADEHLTEAEEGAQLAPSDAQTDDTGEEPEDDDSPAHAETGPAEKEPQTGSPEKPQTVRSLLERWFMRRGDETGETAQPEDVLAPEDGADTAEEAASGDGTGKDDDGTEEKTHGNQDGLAGTASGTTAAMTGGALLSQEDDDDSREIAETEESEATDDHDETAMDAASEAEEAPAPQQNNDREIADRNAGLADDGADIGGGFVFAAQDDPVRFAWTIDDDQTFRSVSPELGETLGPNAADVVGRKWSDVARVFGFDTSGEIGRLLEKRDTWSGKMVLWPVQGTDLAVPVDLAALPSFGSSRSFDGFRGFGIMRTAEAVVDANETGLALTDGLPSPQEMDASNDRFDHDDFGNEDDVARAQLRDDDFDAGEDRADTRTPDENPPAAAPPSSGNVVSLPGFRREQAGDDRRLNSDEERAFKEIGSKLGSDAGNAHDESRVAESAPAGSSGEILDQLPWPVIVYRNGRTLFANRELLAATGYSGVGEIDAAGGVEALFDGGNVEEGENAAMALRHRDGDRSQVSPVLRSVPWDGGKALLLTFRPSAGSEEVRQAIDMARVSELQHILDTATDGIIVTGKSGLIESINGPAEALFGIDFDAARERPLTELFAQESHRALLDYMNELSGPGVASVMNDGREVIGKEANGGLIPLFITLGRMGEAEKYCAVLRDITQWKKAEEELVSARRAAESASEHKSDFLTRVSHEIRTPLNSIIGFSDVMIEERFGAIGNDRYREYLRDINRSGVHILDLINDLLDISKIEAGKMELSFEAVNLNQIVSETVALLQPQANIERIIIRTSLSRSVPRVVADARTVRQIILNLVSNAIKFTPTNGQVIVSTLYDDNGEVALKVRDTGRGMNEDEIEHVLKPFNQISVTEHRRGQGTGLGLPLTKALVEANRAGFDIESTPGEGTIVQVQFPTQRVLAD